MQQKKKLLGLLGKWEGVTRTWFEPGKPAIEEKNTGVFKPGVSEHFVVHEYKSVMGKKPFHGMAIYGYYEEQDKFQCAWIDGLHMSGSIMFSEGKTTEKGFSVLGSYVYDTTTWGWRTEVEILSKDEIKITAYNITPEGKETKGVETIYNRTS